MWMPTCSSSMSAWAADSRWSGKLRKRRLRYRCQGLFCSPLWRTPWSTTLRACQTEQEVTLEVFHEGIMTEKDRENIRRICSDAPLEKHRVGLRNVYKRMKLLYGDRGGLTVEEASPGVIRARLVIPLESAAQAEKESGEVSEK